MTTVGFTVSSTTKPQTASHVDPYSSWKVASCCLLPWLSRFNVGMKDSSACYTLVRLFTAVCVRVLSLRSRVIHGFVTEPWYSRHVPFLCERARLRDMLHSYLEFWFRVGVRTLALRFLSLCECAVSSWFGCALSCPRVFCCVASAACIDVITCAVWQAACVFHWLRAFMLSCLVWTRGLWVFSLAACSCLVLHSFEETPLSWFAKIDLSAAVQKQQRRLLASAVEHEFAMSWKWTIPAFCTKCV